MAHALEGTWARLMPFPCHFLQIPQHVTELFIAFYSSSMLFLNFHGSWILHDAQAWYLFKMFKIISNHIKSRNRSDGWEELGQHPHCVGLKILVVCAGVRFVALRCSAPTSCRGSGRAVSVALNMFPRNFDHLNDCSELSSCQLPVFSE